MGPTEIFIGLPEILTVFHIPHGDKSSCPLKGRAVSGYVGSILGFDVFLWAFQGLMVHIPYSGKGCLDAGALRK